MDDLLAGHVSDVTATPAWVSAPPAWAATSWAGMTPAWAGTTPATPWTPAFHNPLPPAPPARHQPYPRRRPSHDFDPPPRHHRRRSAFNNWWDPNPGVQADPEPRVPPATTPHNRGWGALPPVSGPSMTPATHTTPALPLRQPDTSLWNFPAGTLTWNPHPQPQPGVSPFRFFGYNPLLGRAPPNPWPPATLDPWSAARLTGGWPLPGTVPAMQWTPGTFPPLSHPHDLPVRLAPWLIPNPVNATLPQITWDITQHPSAAKRLTGSHVSVDASTVFKELATLPGVKRLQIVCDTGHMSNLWGPINVERSSKVKIRDVLDAIYEFFQSPLTGPEVSYLESLSRGNREHMEQAFRRRCRESPGLPGFEWRQGLRRVDCLGDKTSFWGLWITFLPDSTWYLNLGLIPSPRR
ncbi:hypothetical protein BV22DRAFT_1107536 [Leucogyrophana mollusca]|uniref:Uncharacterized protein n=1 Tax=Leucogyrophana mollusca TaxID=85980 RepID=A0ACB8B524_9AGAM|nr:hypothetical protein BV22DRAFT_1107536 [Leucogyrophana mollusca]